MAPDNARFSFHDLSPDPGNFLEDVIEGLSRSQKTLPPKYFYDERGCELFEAICGLPEYYPTRTETAIMQAHVHDMVRHLGPRCALIEYGSGNSRKTRILLDQLDAAVYMPIDIAAGQLRISCAGLAQAYPRLAIVAVCADYMRPLTLPVAAAAERRVVYFPGSTIGNLTVPEAASFLGNVRRLVAAGGGLLIGVDLKKDPALLDAAYNDAQGVTAEFNLNLLARANRELGADFDLSAFRHRAFYNAEPGRIEMHLVSGRAQRVHVRDREFHFRADETIHTENSYKYSEAEFQALAGGAGFEPVQCWIDPDRLFAVHYLTAPR